MSACDAFTLLSLEKMYITRGFSLALINWMASSIPLTVMMGSSGPKISSFITLDSPVTSFNTVGAARRQEEETHAKSMAQDVLILLHTEWTNKIQVRS